MVLGCECSGVIDALGQGIKEFSVGDEVYAVTFNRCSNGSYAQYVSAPVELVVKKPAALSFEEAAAVPLAGMTAYRATLATRTFQMGDHVFIAGAGGGVGSYAVPLLRSMGVTEIYTIAKNDRSAAYLQKNLRFKAEQITIYEGLTPSQLREQIFKGHRERLFNATLDLVGQEIKQLCIELTGYSGHFITILPEKEFAMPVWNENSIPRSRNMSLLQIAVGAELSDSNREYWAIYKRHLILLSEMLEKRILKVPAIEVVGSLSASTIERAQERSREGRVKGKLVMKVE